MNDTVAFAYMVAYLMQASLPPAAAPADYNRELKTLNGLRPEIQSWAGQAGYQQCLADVRFEVFHNGSRPNHSPNMKAVSIKPGVTYPLDADKAFNLSVKNSGLAFYWKEYEVQPNKAYSFGKYKKECHIENNKTVCVDYRIFIPENILIRVWPGGGHTTVNASHYNDTEAVEWADL